MINLGLSRVRALLERLGNPQDGLKVFHVAGTNGKGSVCTYLEAALARSGRLTGKFTSPHLVHPSDAIAIGQQPLDPREYADVLARVTSAAQSARIAATEFELQTAAAFTAFAQRKVDVGVVEVGLGGQDDATNVLAPASVLCAVLTHISLDHEAYLGSTLRSVAQHKAGIIKAGRPVVADGFNSAEVLEVVREVAAANHAPLALSAATVATGGDVRARNMAVASLALAEVYDLPASLVSSAMQAAVWPGRLQWLGPELLLDGAHNVAGARQLREYLDTVAPRRPVRFVVAFSKPCAPILAELVRAHDSVVATAFHAVEGMPWIQSVSPTEIVAAARALAADVQSAPSLAELPPFEGLTVVCGSLYLVGEFLARRRAAGV